MIDRSNDEKLRKVAYELITKSDFDRPHNKKMGKVEYQINIQDATNHKTNFPTIPLDKEIKGERYGWQRRNNRLELIERTYEGSTENEEIPEETHHYTITLYLLPPKLIINVDEKENQITFTNIEEVVE